MHLFRKENDAPPKAVLVAVLIPMISSSDKSNNPKNKICINFLVGLIFSANAAILKSIKAQARKHCTLPSFLERHAFAGDCKPVNINYFRLNWKKNPQDTKELAAAVCNKNAMLKETRAIPTASKDKTGSKKTIFFSTCILVTCYTQ